MKKKKSEFKKMMTEKIFVMQLEKAQNRGDSSGKMLLFSLPYHIFQKMLRLWQPERREFNNCRVEMGLFFPPHTLKVVPLVEAPTKGSLPCSFVYPQAWS